MLRPLFLVLVIAMAGCTTSLPPDSSPPAATPAGQGGKHALQQKPIQQKECTTGFGDPCSTCMLKCIPGGDICAAGALNAATNACIRANCAEACPDDR